VVEEIRYHYDICEPCHQDFRSEKEDEENTEGSDMECYESDSENEDPDTDSEDAVTSVKWDTRNSKSDTSIDEKEK